MYWQSNVRLRSIARCCNHLFHSARNASQFDGHWRMVAITTSGHCGEIPFDVGISRGRIYSTGGSSFGTVFAHYLIQLVGSVSAAGADECSGWPAHCLRDRTVRGSGTWAGTGPSGVCSGIWSAHSLLTHLHATESLQTMQSALGRNRPLG